jgi:hypothetical protein
MLDKMLVLDDANTVTASEESVNVIDLAALGIDFGVNDCTVVFRVDTAAYRSGGSTVVFALQTASTENFASPVVLCQSDAIADTALTINTVAWQCKIPAGGGQYLRAYYTVAGGSLTTGKFDCYIMLNAEVR